MTQTSADRKEINLPHGAYSLIARRMRPQVTPQHVRRVALGERRSERVEAAIGRYVESMKHTALVA
jgi:hypothetical protein